MHTFHEVSDLGQIQPLDRAQHVANGKMPVRGDHALPPAVQNTQVEETEAMLRSEFVQSD
jgi:hypothetical protein